MGPVDDLVVVVADAEEVAVVAGLVTGLVAAPRRALSLDPDDRRDYGRVGVKVCALPLYDDPLGPLCDGLRTLWKEKQKIGHLFN